MIGPRLGSRRISRCLGAPSSPLAHLRTSSAILPPPAVRAACPSSGFGRTGHRTRRRRPWRAARCRGRPLIRMSSLDSCSWWASHRPAPRPTARGFPRGGLGDALAWLPDVHPRSRRRFATSDAILTSFALAFGICTGSVRTQGATAAAACSYGVVLTCAYTSSA